MATKQQAPGVEITPEVASIVVAYLAARQRFRDTFPTPRTFDTSWGVPLATLAIWLWIGLLYWQSA